MINTLHIENLKGFQTYDINLGPVNLLVGGNNSGKTTIFHALQLVFWCIEQTSDVGDARVTFKKTQVPEIGALPYFNAKDLFHNQRIRAGNAPTRIRLAIETTAAPRLEFTIYPAFSRNLMVDGANATIKRAQFDRLLELRPIFVPSTIGITSREELYRQVAQERLIAEGRQNQVLRNLIYRLRPTPAWPSFVEIMNSLFRLQGLEVPFDEARDEWLTATYQEGQCNLDFISAGSGFLQIANLLAFLFLHSSRVALLDEPDSHLHDDLQRLAFTLLGKLASEKQIQLIIATHSTTFIDAAGLATVHLVDRAFPAPLRPNNVEELVPLLAERGISLPPTKIMNTLQGRRCLFVEGTEKDYTEFISAMGAIIYRDFQSAVRGLTVFETKGNTAWPFDAIDVFQQLIGVPIRYNLVADRDFFTDGELQARTERAAREGRNLLHLDRRHRESYILNPGAITKLLTKKWQKRNPKEKVPELLTAAGLRAFLLQQAESLRVKTQVDLEVEHESVLRGSADHREAGLLELKRYFEEAYTVPLAAGHIPWKLLDAKAVLRALRTEVHERFELSFSDLEILSEMTPEDVPDDLRAILLRVVEMFGEIDESRVNAPIQYEPAPEKERSPKKVRELRRK